MATDLASGKLHAARVVPLSLCLFLLGAIASSFYICKPGEEKKNTYAIPIAAIIVILSLLIVFGNHYDHSLIETGYFTMHRPVL